MRQANANPVNQQGFIALISVIVATGLLLSVTTALTAMLNDYLITTEQGVAKQQSYEQAYGCAENMLYQLAISLPISQVTPTFACSLDAVKTDANQTIIVTSARVNSATTNLQTTMDNITHKITQIKEIN